MAESSSPAPDIETILLKALREEATEGELQWLNEQLLASEDIRRRSVRFLADESLLSEEFDVEWRASAFAELFSREASPRPVAAPRHSLLVRLVESINSHGVLVALAATVLLAFVFYQYLLLTTKLDRLHHLALVESNDPLVAPGDAESGDRSRDSKPRAVVGRVTGLEGVAWPPGEPELLFGAEVHQGQVIRLESGVLELLLSTGAKVTIEGPADFEATSPSEAAFGHGKLAAAVPRLARGYTIMTPTSELVDIGTQFGVIVEDTGDSELHVFDGHVVARSRLDADGQLLHARHDEAMRFDALNKEPRRMNAQSGSFVRRISPGLEDLRLTPLPVTDGLALWLSADAIAGAQVGERVAVWRDLLVGDNDYADDAWQFDSRRCPVYIVDEADRPALRFDGWSTFLATSPMLPSENRTLFVACTPGPVSFADKSRGGMLLKHTTAPSLELTVFEDRTAQGWVWPGGGSTNNAGVIHGSDRLSTSVSVLSYQYDTESNHSELWVNGKSQGAADAPAQDWQYGRRFIGSHSEDHINAFYFGNIYEVVLFEKSLTAEEKAAVDGYFRVRYAGKGA